MVLTSPDGSLSEVEKIPIELHVVAAFVLALAGALIATPVAIRIARRTEFYDRPLGYKRHGQSTPYLGGSAVIIAFLLAAGLLGDFVQFWPLGLCVLTLAVIGTVDDRRNLRPATRVGFEIAAGVILWQAGLGWHLFDSTVANLGLTVVWVLGIVNAFNLMDNLDGATGTIGAVSGAGIGALGLTYGDSGLAVIGLSMSGACIGFLRLNLAAPARIFLGDGGSMPLGLIAASGAASVGSAAFPGSGLALLDGALLVGLVILDSALVIVSRTRSQVPLLTGGRDHLTHRLLGLVGTPRRVAIGLAVSQAGLCGITVATHTAGDAFLLVSSGACVALGLVLIGILEARWEGHPETARKLVVARSRWDVTPSPIPAAPPTDTCSQGKSKL